jgi:hypothetical protein
MARRVYFAFHYQKDISRVNVVRKSGVIQGSEQAGFYDASLWEKARKTGDDAIKRMINDSLKGTSVTVFLLGAETAGRPWVRYELQRSCGNGNGLLGVYIHNIKNLEGYTSSQGVNILEQFQVTEANGTKLLLSQKYRTYDWVYNDGYKNFGTWVEEAARLAARQRAMN